VAISATNGSLAVDALELAFEDIVIEPEVYPPNGVHLTELSLVLAAAATEETTWSDSSGAAHGEIDVTLRWSVLKYGEVTALADQTLATLDFALALGDDGDALELEASQEGLSWSFGELLTMSDVSVGVTAGHTSERPAPR
jgi:hypothetical protein